MTNLLRSFLSVGLLVLVAVASCSSEPVRSTLGEKPTVAAGAATPQPATDEEALLQLMAAEGAAVVRKDIAGLMDLWSEGGAVTDAKHTPDEPGDDATWRGKDAIRERYVALVFPGNPQSAGAADAQLRVEGDRATASSTTRIGSELAPGGDRWTFVKRDGRWWIESLTYNLER